MDLLSLLDPNRSEGYGLDKLWTTELKLNTMALILKKQPLLSLEGLKADMSGASTNSSFFAVVI